MKSQRLRCKIVASLGSMGALTNKPDYKAWFVTKHRRHQQILSVFEGLSNVQLVWESRRMLSTCEFTFFLLFWHRQSPRNSFHSLTRLRSASRCTRSFSPTRKEETCLGNFRVDCRHFEIRHSVDPTSNCIIHPNGRDCTLRISSGEIAACSARDLMQFFLSRLGILGPGEWKLNFLFD